MLRDFGSGLVKLSKAFGVVTALIGFPAALYGALRFSGEIVDTVSAPDIGVAIENLTLRCFYRFSDQATYNIYVGNDEKRAAEVFENVCRRAPLSVSFEAVFHNRDRIVRTITSVEANLTLPPTGPGIEAVFDMPWAVVHRIEGVYETNTRTSWQPLRLEPGVRQSQEIWLIQNVPHDRKTKWASVVDWLASPDAAPENETVAATVSVTSPGVETTTAQVVCPFRLRPRSLETFRGYASHNRFQFTGACAQD